MGIRFNALVVTEQAGQFNGNIQEIDTDELPEGDLLIKVSYSSVNYKDVLSSIGNRGVTKKYPHIPGVDAAGVIVNSKKDTFETGDKVLVTGFDLGMNTWGGFGEYISVPVEWAIPLPDELSLKESMCFGTAGLTAALSINELLKAGLTPEQGEVVVSGATGGVGSMAIAILTRLGFNITAVSGKSEERFLLDILGASRIINREDFIGSYAQKPVSRPTFAAGIDTVGGPVLSGMLKSVQYGGTVTCCGMVASAELNTSIFPFILRGVHLAGIDSVLAPLALREQLWKLMANEWKPIHLSELIQEITLDILADKLLEIGSGKAMGRYVLRYDNANID